VLESEGKVTGVVAEATRIMARSNVKRLPVHIRVEVTEGVVTLNGWIDGTALVPVAERLARAVEGVADVHCRLAPVSVRSDVG
jgi:osmotically-inducible protein OsmY